MRNTLLIFIVSCALLFVTACKKKEDVTPNLPQPVQMSTVIKLDNCTYIPINVAGVPDNNVGIILNAIAQFERANPKLDIRFWQITYSPQTYYTASRTYGIWIYHRTKL